MLAVGPLISIQENPLIEKFDLIFPSLTLKMLKNPRYTVTFDKESQMTIAQEFKKIQMFEILHLLIYR